MHYHHFILQPQSSFISYPNNELTVEESKTGHVIVMSCESHQSQGISQSSLSFYGLDMLEDCLLTM